MSKSQQKEQEVDVHEDVDLRGTFVSVTIIGIFLLLSWLGVWYIFISR